MTTTITITLITKYYFSEIFNIALHPAVLNRLLVLFYFVTVIAFVNVCDSYLIMNSYLL